MSTATNTPIALDAVASDLAQVLFREHEESCYEIEEIDGRVPEYVRGTWYLNGPARFERGSRRYENWLDGDGMVCAVRFDEGGVHFTNRFVQTKKLLEEDVAGEFLHRTFGTAFEGDRLKRGLGTESPANVSVIPFNGRLLAFGEQSIPLELDPVSLDTIGPFDFFGQLNSISPFSAHPKIDPRNGEFLNFGIAFSQTQPLLHYYRFGTDGQLLCRTRTKLSAPRSLHDFTVSDNYVSFYLSPHVLNMDRLRSGDSTLGSLDWSSSPSELLILNRTAGDIAARLEIDNGYSLHTINSFECDGLLFLDLIELERPVYADYGPLPHLFESPPHGRPVRFVIDVVAGRIVDKFKLPYRSLLDFPCVHPNDEQRMYDRCWMLGIPDGEPGETKFFTQLVAFHWSDGGTYESYTTPDGVYLAGEPVCICNPTQPNECVVVCQQYNAARDTGGLAFFDGRKVRDGPLATLTLRTPIHFGFHATFAHATSQAMRES